MYYDNISTNKFISKQSAEVVNQGTKSSQKRRIFLIDFNCYDIYLRPSDLRAES